MPKKNVTKKSKKTVKVTQEVKSTENHNIQAKPTKSESFVSLVNINKIYDNKFHAVTDFNIDIKKKEFIVFVGPSGCGKSTTLRMIAGLEDISTGDLIIDGERCNDLLSKDRDVAMVFQNYALYPNMTIYKNMAFALQVRKVDMPVYNFDKKNPEYLKKKEALIEEYKKQIEQGSFNFKKDKEKLKAYKKSKLADFRTKLFNLKAEYSTPVMVDFTKKIKSINKKIESYNQKIESAPKEEIDNLKNQIKELEDKKHELENKKIPLIKYRHYKKDEIEEKVKTAAKILEIEDQLDKKPKELSGGQRQRVALGRSIVRNARIFLMDEPLSNLDAKLRIQMRAEIIRLHKKLNATTIYVTHDQTEAMTMADRIVVMKLGFVQQIDTPIEIYRHPANKFVASFIGSPSMNFIDGTYNKGTVIFKNGEKIKLDQEQIKAHDLFYKGLHAKESSGLRAFNEKLESEKAEFERKHNSEKTIKEFNEKYEKVKNDKNNLINELESIIKGQPHKITFGIRPEAITQVQAKKGNNDNILVREVKLSELLGDEYYLHFDYAQQDLLSKIISEKLITAGTKVVLQINKDKIHLFDPNTEVTIC